jgi:hypothetical protein
MNEQDKLPREIAVPIVAAVAMHALLSSKDRPPSAEAIVSDAFAVGDAFANELERRGLLAK